MTHGRITWRELQTTDPETASRFYPEVFDWHVEPVDLGGVNYRLVKQGGQDIAGIRPVVAIEGYADRWVPFIEVKDVDASVDRALALGAKVLSAASDIPNVGRFAVIADPQGGVVTLFYNANPMAPRQDRPNDSEFSWEQIDTADPEGTRRFYSGLFGWTVVTLEGVDTFAVDGRSIVSIVPAAPGASTRWLSHIVVDDLVSACGVITSAGGAVQVPEVVVPNVGAYAVVTDPKGAAFCVFRPGVAQKPDL